MFVRTLLSSVRWSSSLNGGSWKRSGLTETVVIVCSFWSFFKGFLPFQEHLLFRKKTSRSCNYLKYEHKFKLVQWHDIFHIFQPKTKSKERKETSSQSFVLERTPSILLCSCFREVYGQRLRQQQRWIVQVCQTDDLLTIIHRIVLNCIVKFQVKCLLCIFIPSSFSMKKYNFEVFC